MRRWQRRTLVALDAFLAVSAVGGGLALLSHWIDLPTEVLKGSPFRTFTIPGLALTILVGGGAIGATVAVLRRPTYGALLSVSAGLMVIVFLVVEVAVVGSEPGFMRSLQAIYFANGLLLIAVALWPSVHRHSIDRSSVAGRRLWHTPSSGRRMIPDTSD